VSRQKRKHCDMCGETQGKKPLRSMVVQVDGKTRANYRLCLVCMSIKLIRLNDSSSRMRER